VSESESVTLCVALCMFAGACKMAACGVSSWTEVRWL
jgi:hypothetical protein